MENYYLTEQTSSTDEYSKSLEYLIPNSVVKSKEKSDLFHSYGDGLLSEGFYLGQNLTKNLADIEVRDSNSCILSIPSKGYYSTKFSQKTFKTNTPVSGSIFLPTDSIHYSTNLNVIEDLMIIIGYDQLEPILEKKYGIHNVKKAFFNLDKRNQKVKVVYDLIINNLQVLRFYPHLRESLHYKSSIKEVAKLLLAELIADSLNVDFKFRNSPDSQIVKKAEELIEANPESFFSIQEIAEKVHTSARNLQLAFKKHRGCNPMQFLKERKLHKARLQLINPDSGTLIKEIAYNSGFLNMSSFSKYYQELFGELPSETFQSAKQFIDIE